MPERVGPALLASLAPSLAGSSPVTDTLSAGDWPVSDPAVTDTAVSSGSAVSGEPLTTGPPATGPWMTVRLTRDLVWW